MSNTMYNLKNIRKMRNMTPTELGKACDFDDKTAYVRIADYERYKRNPKDDQVWTLAHILNVIPAVLLSAPHLTTNEEFAWRLIEMDKSIGITIEEGKISFDIPYFQDFINEWELKKKQLANKEITRDEYNLWTISRRL